MSGGRGRSRRKRRGGRRGAALVLSLALAAGAAYLLLLHESRVAPRLALPTVTATIGSGSEAVGVSADGRVLRWLPLPEGAQLPRLPLTEPPAKRRLAGPALQQARVLGAAPATLRPYLDGSGYGPGGVEVELRSGIELRFGDASRAGQKWRAAAAVLADPSVEALDYVDLQSPRRPAVGGSGHALPPVP